LQDFTSQSRALQHKSELDDSRELGNVEEEAGDLVDDTTEECIRKLKCALSVRSCVLCVCVCVCCVCIYVRVYIGICKVVWGVEFVGSVKRLHEHVWKTRREVHTQVEMRPECEFLCVVRVYTYMYTPRDLPNGVGCRVRGLGKKDFINMYGRRDEECTRKLKCALRVRSCVLCVHIYMYILRHLPNGGG